MEKYSFLKDPRALAEIRKHKWIESQKAGREIGFATAACDWVDKYGQPWKENHVKEGKNYSAFIEKRRFRRFRLDCDIELKNDAASLMAHRVDISYFGVSCITSNYLNAGSRLNIHLRLNSDSSNELNCGAIVERVAFVDHDNYELFLKFDETSQQQIENSKFFSN
ncbi:MAG: PilZ domain-containing protein [Candidatus Omnitrophica bacterium]|nr:PilZ domain-containing protein [Candidatus Omnitrophota bacterium]